MDSLDIVCIRRVERIVLDTTVLLGAGLINLSSLQSRNDIRTACTTDADESLTATNLAEPRAA